jgi:hypothetical protein
MRHALILLVVLSMRLAGTPILFEPNRGQTASSACFLAQARGYRVLLERTSAVFEFGGEHARLSFAGAKPASVEGEFRTQAVRNYALGNQPSGLISGVPTFERVRYRSLLPGVDLIFYAAPELEFDLALAPGANPAAIELCYDGFRGVDIEANGDLLLKTKRGVMRQRVPEVTQDGRQIRARYVRRDGGGIGIEVARYDTTRALLIDPRISYATYLGGSGGDIVGSIATDADGNYYVAAQTSSPDYPRLPAGQTFPGDADIVVSKFSANNTLVYSTVIGGA